MEGDKANGLIEQPLSRLNDSNQRTETIRTSLTPLIAIFAAMCTGLGTGSVLGSSSSAQDKEQRSWVVSTVPIGAIVGSLTIGIIIARFGRKMAMFATSVPSIVGWILVCFYNDVGMVIVGRILLGISIGFVYVVVAIYISEISVKETIGKSGIFFYLMCTTGIVFANAFGHYLAYNIICVFMPIGSVVALIYMPESSTYLVNRYDTEINNRTPIWSRIKQLFELKVFTVIGGLMFFQQMSGINAVIFYTEFIVNSAHGNINIDAVIISIVHVIVTFAASLVVDKCGHRFLLATSIAIMALCQLLLCVYFSLYIPNSMHSLTNWAWSPLAIFCLYIAAYSLGLGPIPWLMVVKLFPADMKVIGVSAAVAFNWLIAFAVVKMFVPIGIGISFLISCIFSVLGFVFILIMVPKSETKGNSRRAEERTMPKEISSTTERGRLNYG
ncbi:facilitated trehalose transporter Tret1-like isoform X2 [Bradysia coprophila]|uniref:facilitated trehalose transporter Tret1-like isoform X2 n=1 Tax=Bradysia coprophila TaxID=38358 RepID=UPI00187D90AD|nr:facilitated trehalose transporter Tret1-like isoform X2 [Bradysia coprophila]